jgi:hypothetical protein
MQISCVKVGLESVPMKRITLGILYFKISLSDIKGTSCL